MKSGAGLAAMTMRLEFKVLRCIWKTNSRIITPDFRGADIGVFRNLFGTIPQEIVLEGKRLGDLVDFQGHHPQSTRINFT